MFVGLLVAVVTCACALLYARWLSVRQFWKRKNVPHDPPHPVYGSLTYLQKKNAGEWMRELYNKFATPYVGIWLFWRPALVINSPDIARRVLVKDADNFRDRYLGSGKSDPIGSLNVFTTNDPLWSSVRRRMTAVFTTAKLKAFQVLILTKANELVQRVKNENVIKNHFDLRSVYADYTTDIIGTAAFGVQSDATLTGGGPMRKVTNDFQTYNVFRGLAHTCIFFFPAVVDIFRFSFFPKSATEYFKNIFYTMVEQRGGFEKPILENRDLLDALIKMKQDAKKENEEISNDVLLAQAAIFVQGGFETSAGTLAFITYELAYNLEVQDKLYNEIYELKQKLGDNDFDMETLAEATYMNCVIKETLRKYPPMGWLDRIAAKDYIIDENLTIPAGTPVYVNVVATQVDPKYFPEPEQFIPERFLPENEKDIVAFTYAPFGEGPRNCIGRRFAHQTLRFGLALLILNFKFRPLVDMPKPKDIALEKQSLFLMPGQKLSVEFIPRT